MTLQKFRENLKAAHPDIYETAAPKNLQTYAVWHRYGRSPIFGDDRNQAEGTKIQIDILTPSYDHILIDSVASALWLMDIPYSVESEGYEDELNAYRTILQMVVV
jgi:hypothetical protein